jgi:GNAT superfamily N-acetyltransferase
VATSEALAIERLGRDDVAAGLALSGAAGWNQNADDWAFFIAEGSTFGLRDDAGTLVASAAALPYDGAVGWISMVLVDGRHRHRGLATRLLDVCVDALRSVGRVPVLDATPAGAEVYRQSGFIAGFAFERWQGEGAAADRGAAAGDGAPSDRAEVDAIVALDRSICGVGRGSLLQAFLDRSGSRAWLTADTSGFALSRAGRRAIQIGPVVAAGDEAAIGLVETALAAAAGRVFIDVPAHQPAVARALERRGFVRQRPFVRMALVDTPALAASARVFALAGPEFG